jgi:hypothetical protein
LLSIHYNLPNSFLDLNDKSVLWFLGMGLLQTEPPDKISVQIFMNSQKILQSLIVSVLLVATSQGAIAGSYYHHSHYRHDHGGALAAALIVGGLFGYLIGESHHDDRSYGYRTDYTPRSTVVYQPVERLPTVITTGSNSEFSGSDCLMTREYTTTITISGIDREAYGTRCMTADGGWILGRPKLMPDH